MKKYNNIRTVLISVTVIVALLLCNSLVAFAATDTSIWTEGLQPGERVVEVYSVRAEDNSLDLSIEDKDTEFPSVELNEANLRWYATSSTSNGKVYGSWKYAGVSTESGGILSASQTATVSHTYSGTLKATIKELEALIGFNTTKSFSATVGFTSNAYPKIPGKGHRLEYRDVYNQYKVKQEKKYDRRATKSYGTEYVYPEKWVERKYRVVEYDIK